MEILKQKEARRIDQAAESLIETVHSCLKSYIGTSQLAAEVYKAFYKLAAEYRADIDSITEGVSNLATSLSSCQLELEMAKIQLEAVQAANGLIKITVCPSGHARLSPNDGGCPFCKIKVLESENEVLKSDIAIFSGYSPLNARCSNCSKWFTVQSKSEYGCPYCYIAGLESKIEKTAAADKMAAELNHAQYERFKAQIKELETQNNHLRICAVDLKKKRDEAREGYEKLKADYDTDKYRSEAEELRKQLALLEPVPIKDRADFEHNLNYYHSRAESLAAALNEMTERYINLCKRVRG